MLGVLVVEALELGPEQRLKLGLAGWYRARERGDK